MDNTAALFTVCTVDIALLPVEVLPAVFSQIKDIKTLKGVMSSSSRLRQPAADCVQTLLAVEGSLSAAAWARFRNASGILLLLRPEVHPGYACFRSGMFAAADFLPAALQSIAALPERVTAITACVLPGQWYRLKGEQAIQLAQAIIKSSCSSNLQDISLQAGISAAAADLLGGQLKEVQHLSLTVSTSAGDDDAESEASDEEEKQQDQQQQFWRPVLPEKLSSLSLTFSKDDARLDLSALADAKELKKLSLDAHKLQLVNISGLSVAASITELQLRDSNVFQVQRSDGPKRLLMQVWQLMRQAPGISTAVVSKLMLGEQQLQQPIRGLTSLTIEDCESEGAFLWEGPEDKLAGCLATALPDLQELRVRCSSSKQLLAAVQGHPCLKGLTAIN
jgi:hypothetical protein